jgi:hypothetical protein
MGFGARLPGTKLTFLSRLSAASGTPHRQRLFLSDSHGYIMRVYSAARWSVLTSAFELSQCAVNAVNGKILGLRVRQANFDLGTIRLDVGTTKNREGREVAMTKRVAELCGRRSPRKNLTTPFWRMRGVRAR